MYSCGPPHMANQKQDDQLEHTYSSYVRIQDVTLTTCRRRWMIGRCGERGSGISVLAARHDDDDIIVHKLFVLDKNTWNYIIAYRLLALDRNIFNHIILYKLLVMIGWLVVLFYSVSTILGSFNVDLNFKRFSLV